MKNIKILLGETASNYTDEQITLAFDMAKAEVEAYCKRSIDTELEYCAMRIAVIKLLRMGTEGITAQSYSGVSETMLDGYPSDVVFILNRKRKVKVL